MIHTPFHTAAFAGLCLAAHIAQPAALLAQQTTRVIPSGYDSREGNSSYSYPFRSAGAIQVIYGGDQLGTKANALINGIAFRANAPFKAITGFKKKMKLTVYGTTTTPKAMTIDPVKNAAGAKATIAFNKDLTLPAVAATARAPGPFQLPLPFSALYVLDTTKHNLLAHLEPGDATPLPSSSWSLDAVNHYKTKAFAHKVKIGARCADANSNYLSLTVSSASHNGSSLGVSLKRSSRTPIGTFPLAFIGLDFVHQRQTYPVPLVSAGMPGCQLQIDPQLVFANQESATGTYTGLSIAIPDQKAILGLTYVVQGLGTSAKGLAGGVVTDTYQVVNSPSSGVAPTSQGIFYNTRTAKWFMSSVGAYYPVTRFDGVFP